MSTKSLEDIFVEEIVKRVIGHGHDIDDGDRGVYGGSVTALFDDEVEIACEEDSFGTFNVKIKGTSTVQHVDSDGQTHDTDFDIEIAASVQVDVTSHDSKTSAINARIDVAIDEVVLTKANLEDNDQTELRNE